MSDDTNDNTVVCEKCRGKGFIINSTSRGIRFVECKACDEPGKDITRMVLNGMNIAEEARAYAIENEGKNETDS